MSKPDFKIKLHNTIYLLIMHELRKAMTTAPNKYVEATINEKYVDYYEVYAPEIATKRLEALFDQLIQDERREAVAAYKKRLVEKFERKATNILKNIPDTAWREGLHQGTLDAATIVEETE